MWLRFIRKAGGIARDETGIGLLETVVALGLVALMAVTLTHGATAISKATAITDWQSTADSLAESQMDWVKNSTYFPEASTYTAAALPSGKDYINYAVSITAAPLNTPDDGIQKISVSVSFDGRAVSTLTGYKVSR